MEESTLVQRKKKEDTEKEPQINKAQAVCHTEGPSLTLMEEVYLLGLNRKGFTSFWNTSLSSGLRACILVELAFQDKIELESCQIKKKKLPNRFVKVKNGDIADDAILAEALKNIKSAPNAECLRNWIDYFNGETWNPIKLGYTLKNVRERVAKSLVEKGVLTTSKENFFLFDFVTHPLVAHDVRNKLIKKVQDALLTNWVNDPQRFDHRLLALLYLAHISEVLEEGLEDLPDAEYETACTRLGELLELDFELESLRDYTSDVFWGVIIAFLK